MHDVFISYSSREMGTAETVRNILEQNQIRCWMAPRDIPGGSNYTKEIPVAIRNCQVFVLILSENAQSSQWVLKELDMAVNCGKVILPFMLEDCQLNDEFNFLLTGAQRYDAYQKKAEAMEKLVKRIQAVISMEVECDPVKEMPAQDSEQPAPPPQPEEKAEAVFGLVQCPACGSNQVRQMDKIGKYVGKGEWMFGGNKMVAILLGGFPAIIIVGLTGLILPFLLTWVIATLWLHKCIKGKMDKEVHNLRVRNHIRPYPYQCQKCDWVFLLNEDGTVVKTKKK